MSIIKNDKINNWEIESLNPKHGDLEYIYYIWQAYDKDTWISIFEIGFPPYCPTCDQEVKGDKLDKCIFVGKPNKLITKYGSQEDESYYKLNTNNDG